MKKLLVLCSFLFLCHFLSAQDYILKRNGEEIYGHIKEISPSEIKYTDTLTTGVLRILSKSEVFMIKYRNGVKEVFEAEKKETGTTSNSSGLEGPIVDVGGNDYKINDHIYGFSYVRRLLLSVDDPEIKRLLVQARLEGLFGNILAYSSIPVGIIGLALLADGVDYGDAAYTVGGITGLTLCFASNAANIVFKIDKRKKISEAISLYNKKIEEKSAGQ